MGNTLIEKIIMNNVGAKSLTPGQIVTVSVDRVMIHDIFIPFVAEKFKEMMMTIGELARDVGTVAVGKGAVDCGLIDQVGGLGDALDYLRQRIQENQEKEKADSPTPVTNPSACAEPAPTSRKGRDEA